MTLQVATDPIGQVFRLLTTEVVRALDARGSEPLYAEIQDYERNKIAAALGADTPRVASGTERYLIDDGGQTVFAGAT
jgi:hypothetical protein